MRAVVVYESFWGNTAAVAQAIAAGLGPNVPALTTGEATPEAVAGADLIVAGSPVVGFRMPTEKMRDAIRAKPGAPEAPDLSQPSMASWLQGLAAGRGAAAAFDTRIRGPFGSAAPAILKGLEAAGYRRIARPRGFTVTGTYGPLREGELDRAREWGAELARSLA